MSRVPYSFPALRAPSLGAKNRGPGLVAERSVPNTPYTHDTLTTLAVRVIRSSTRQMDHPVDCRTAVCPTSLVRDLVAVTWEDASAIRRAPCRGTDQAPSRVHRANAVRFPSPALEVSPARGLAPKYARPTVSPSRVKWK